MSTYDEHAGDDRVGDEGDDPAVIPGDPAADGIAHDDLIEDGIAREDLEGGYTEADDEGPHVRTVHGQYTETDEYPGPQAVTEGSYVDRDGAEEVLAVDEQGEYTETDAGTGRRTRGETELDEDAGLDEDV